MNNGARFEHNYKSTIIYNPTCIDYFLRDSLKDANTVKKKKEQYYNIPASFDIETSSFLDSAGDKTAIMYEWTFGINGYCLIGRTWLDFLKLYNAILEYSAGTHLIVYVHNLAYEFQFMRKYFEWSEVFAIDNRKPIKAITADGLEFRCSYLLSGYNLANLGKNLNKYRCEKMSGDLDYKKIRHSKTPLTSAEIGYCLNDVKVVMCYIMECIEQENNNILNIPMTKTGYVRRYCRNLCFGNDLDNKKAAKRKRYRYNDLMKSLTIEPDEYLMLKRAFQGGYTHASPFYSGETVQDVYSMDFTSSYPAQMIKQRFPMSKGERHTVTSSEDFVNSLKLYACVFDIEFFDIESVFLYDDYISASRCYQLEKPVIDNGRLVSAAHLITTITEQDFAIISKCYKWETMRVGKMYRYYKRYLPHDFVRAILTLYKQKTTLKGVQGAEVNYLLYKGMLNSCYGMAVTDIVRDENIYNGNWSTATADIVKALDNYNQSHARFLFYPWGVWVTAYARRALWTGIFELKDDYIYSDTDSVKYINPKKHKDYFNCYNENNLKALQVAMYYHGFDNSEIEPETIKGIKKPIGVWDYDGHYKKFKALRAKCYMVQYDNDNINITVSGLNKKITVPYLQKTYKNVFRGFSNNLYVPAEYTGKNTHTYIDEEKSGIVKDYYGTLCEFKELSGVHLSESDYSLSLSDLYVSYLLQIKEEDFG